MILQDAVAVRGRLAFRVMRCGRVIEEYVDKNMIMNLARDALAELVGGGGAGKVVTEIGFGTDGVGPSPDDTGLTAPYVKPVSGCTYPVVGQAQFSWDLGINEANGMIIHEFGLLCSDGTLFARKTRGGIEKAADISLTGSWTIIF